MKVEDIMSDVADVIALAVNDERQRILTVIRQERETYKLSGLDSIVRSFDALATKIEHGDGLNELD